jgi:hypothetical protein
VSFVLYTFLDALNVIVFLVVTNVVLGLLLEEAAPK